MSNPVPVPVHTCSRDRAAPVADLVPLLAGLGPLLVVSRDGGERTPPLLDVGAARALAWVGRDGPREALRFGDAADATLCYLLPDSDYLCWERLSARLGGRRGHGPPRRRTLWWPRSSAAASARVCRLLGTGLPAWVLAWPVAALSPVGAGVALRIARGEAAHWQGAER